MIHPKNSANQSKHIISDYAVDSTQMKIRYAWPLTQLQLKRHLTIIGLIIVFGIAVLFFTTGGWHFKNLLYFKVLSFGKTGEADALDSDGYMQMPRVAFIYSLDSQCNINPNDSSTTNRVSEFDIIFNTGRWNTVGSRSGPGSSIEGTYDWVRHLRKLFETYSIRSMADIPCGDTYWQFSLRDINTIQELYFGGDISLSVIKQNKRLYQSKHHNKIFEYWDLVNCPIPTYTFKNSTHEVKNNRFELVMVRDAIQHMHVRNGLKAVRNVIKSGAKFFALTTYPPNTKSSAPRMRSMGGNESLPQTFAECNGTNYCAYGAIKDGDWYANNINCYPFNFPLDKAILVQKSHEHFPMEQDEIHIYKIDDQLVKIVDEYDKACS